MTAKEHYDTHLAEVYSWMLGDFDSRVAEEIQFFTAEGIVPGVNGLAIDLGAGNGVQSIALARLGFKVNAVDFNGVLLDELRSRANKLPITIHHVDIVTFLNTSDQHAGLIVCMGDTITHLETLGQVEDVVSRTARLLIDGGTAIFSYRDLSQERKGADRFIHVRSDDNRSMTCYLEYFPQYVAVHDIITEKRNGSWTQRVGSYPKLRLAVADFENILRATGISVLRKSNKGGMTFIVGRKF